jgi:UDP-glucose 4-epimerase
LELLLSGGECKSINLGTGIGISVKEIISVCENMTGMKVPVIISGRRQGDPPSLVASNNYAKSVLDFSFQYDINSIIRTAWAWEKNKKY